MIDYITFDGTRYPVREIHLTQYAVDVKVSAASLEDQLFDDEDGYTSRDAQLIDELIFFFAPDEMVLSSSDEELERYICDQLVWI